MIIPRATNNYYSLMSLRKGRSARSGYLQWRRYLTFQCLREYDPNYAAAERCRFFRAAAKQMIFILGRSLAGYVTDEYGIGVLRLLASIRHCRTASNRGSWQKCYQSKQENCDEIVHGR